MKSIVKVNSIFENKNKQMLLIENQSCFSLEIDLSKDYIFELNEIKSKRSIEQNKKLWKIIHKISNFEKKEITDTYCEILETSNAKYDYLMGLEEVKQSLLKTYRAVKTIRYIVVKGTKYAIFKCYLGSSTFSTKEMNKLIENAIIYAINLGLKVEEN